MRGLRLRFDAALISVLVLALAGCGGGGTGGGSSMAASNLVPVTGPSMAPAIQSGPVSYMQSSGPLSSDGSVPQGAHQALVAVMSSQADAPQTFSADTLTVSAGGSTAASQSRAIAQGRPVERGRAAPVEAFPADARELTARLRAFAVPGTAASPARRTTQSALSSASIGAQASIWVQQGSLSGARRNIQVPATLAAQTQHGNIWIDQSIAPQLTGDLPQIEADFENAYASDTAHFAGADYPNGAPGLQAQYSTCSAGGAKSGTGSAYITEPADRRIDVMIVSAQNLGGLGGYFSAANLMQQSALNCVGGDYKSNQAPFIFVGWFPGSGTTYDLQEDLVRSTAHELQHLINYVNHAILAPGASSASFNGNEESYINEGLSMLAQDFAVQRMYGSQGVQFDADDALARAGAYLANPGAFSVSGFSGVDAAAWGGDGTNAQFNCAGGCYGAAYLFERYLHDRFGGDRYTHAIETSGQTGAKNLQAVTGEPAGMLLDDFALAMAAGTLNVSGQDARFDFGSLQLQQRYRDQFGGYVTLNGAFATAAQGTSTDVQAPVGGFAFVSYGSVPAAGMAVQVTDRAAASGFGLTGGLAQH